MEFVRKHIHAIIGVIIYIITVLILLLLFGFTTPLPLPEEQGILIDFGGSGTREAASPAPRPRPQPQPQRTESSGVVTQDFEETVSMPSSEVPSNATVTDTPSQTNETEDESAEDATESSRRDLDNLFQGAFGSGTSGSGSGSGTGHPGMGDGSGEGTSSGPGGIGGSLEGRRLVHRVEPEGRANLVGTVVFRITVNENGNVTSVVLVRSTCPECVELARQAVRQWRWAPSPGSGYQTGNVTINFEPQ